MIKSSFFYILLLELVRIGMALIRKIKRFKSTYLGIPLKGIKHYNWWGHTEADAWFARFITSRLSLKEAQQFSFVSVFGKRRTFWFNRHEKKIFYTGENIKRFPVYADYALPYTVLSMGFDFLDHPKYIRFPLWIMYLFDGTENLEQLHQKVTEINQARYKKTDFASLIARHEGDTGLRKELLDALNKIDSVSCAGTFYHNDDRLWEIFNNQKVSYLKQFQFSVCPENSNCFGYVTEKVFEAFKARAIPVYWGSDNQIELGLVNQDAVLFWQQGADNSKVLNIIEDLHVHPKHYNDFIDQEPLLSALADYVFQTYQKVEDHLKALI